MSRTLAILFLGVACTAQAQERTHDITPDDYFSLATITQLAVSPDGKQVVYVEARWDKADDARKTDLWVVPTDGKHAPRRLTGDRASDRNPKWASDNNTIYFLGNRKRTGETKPPHDGSSQVWKLKLTPEGLEPSAVTSIVGGVTGFDYAAKADAVFYSVDKKHSDQDAFSELRAKFATAEYGHGVRKVSEVHRLDLATWRTTKIIDDKRYLREFAVSGDGNRVAMISAFDDSVVKSEGESRVDIWEKGEPPASAGGGKITTPPTDTYRAKAASPYAWLENLAWSPDAKRLAFCSVFDAYPAEIIVVSESSGGWQVSTVGRPSTIQVRGYGSPIKFGDTFLSCLGESRGNVELLNASLDKPALRRYQSRTSGKEFPFQGVIYAKDFRVEGGMSAAVYGEHDNFAKLGVAEPYGEHPPRYKPLVDPNPHTATWKVPTVQHITWKAPDGAEAGGVLELPPGYKQGDKLPLVVAIHGGPTTSTKANLEFDPHNGRLYFAARGYVVLLPNYRGSIGYGDKFVTDLIGKENDIEVKDIIAGIQHLVKQGIADPDRVGVMGWSNGGYLTNCLITLKDSPVKFKAASSGAGIVDTVSEWGFNDEPAYPIVFKKGLPWEQPEIYRKTSPTYGIGNVTTPTLIHVGGGDERCPPGHSRMLYRALREYRKVPTELVVYTGEPHGLTKMSNRKAKMEWDLAWFDKYLKSR